MKTTDPLSSDDLSVSEIKKKFSLFLSFPIKINFILENFTDLKFQLPTIDYSALLSSYLLRVIIYTSIGL